MNLQWMGAILIIVGCGGIGFGMALNYKREELTLRQLLKALEFMRCELNYRMTPLPELCKAVAAFSTGIVKNVFTKLAEELTAQVAPDAACCMLAVLKDCKSIPRKTADALAELGNTLGRFDLDGQMQGLSAVMQMCDRELQEMESNRTDRLRSYQTLGLCAGAALAILLI